MSTLDGTLEETQTPENGNEEIDYEAKYKALQADYTKKSQRIKELENYQIPQETQDPDGEQLKQWLNANGYARRDEIENIKESLTADQRFADLISANPELKKQEKVIKEMAQLKGMAYEDVIEEYGFGSMDKLNKAKDRRLVGDRQLVENKEKSISELSPHEWDEWKRANSKKGNSFVKSNSF